MAWGRRRVDSVRILAAKDLRIPLWAVDTVTDDFALHKQWAVDTVTDDFALHKQWADWYTEQTGVRHDVDHAVPLRGRWVSGLHCADNFQILDGPTNWGKCNRWGPEWDREARDYTPEHIRELETT